MELPQEFVKMLDQLGLNDLPNVLATTTPAVAVRLNAAKGATMTSDARTVAWEPLGMYCDERPAFTFDPAMYQGLYYVQDPSSMITGEIVRRLTAETPTRPLRYLDVCAAPGGKTTAAIASLPAGSFVMANEYDSDRARALVDNLERWGTSRVVVTCADGRSIGRVGPMFDIVAVDAPCSGEGMMRKNDIAVSQWSPRLVVQCAALQRDIVASAWEALRPGGTLIYSTCTFNRSEDEMNAEWIRDELGGIPVDLGLDRLPGVMGGIDTDIPCARFVPGRIEGEGLFVAVFTKPAEADGSPSPRRKNRTDGKPRSVNPPDVSDWITDGYVLSTAGRDDLRAIHRDDVELVETIARAGLRILTAGIHIATMKGGKALPTQALATSDILRREAFPETEVDYATAIAFLRGEALRLPGDTLRGFVLLVYGGHPLGFVKNIGNRANNLLPAGLRIRSANIPDSPPCVLH